jgi:very-short-patch-repair endonuclease
MGAKNIGKQAWNKGKTKETDSKIAKYAKSLTGKRLPLEVRLKISEIHKGKASWNKGKHWVTAEIKKKISEKNKLLARKMFEERPEIRKIIGEASKRNWQNPEYRGRVSKGISVALKTYYKTHPEARAMLSERAKKWIEDNPEKMLQLIKEARVKIKRCNTSLEQKVASLLDTLNLGFTRQLRVGRKFVDFVIPQKKIVIECDGKFWHQDKEKEKERDEYMLSKLGRDWKILHVNEDSVDSLFQSTLTES